jgi:broad specificity phosphatase PhoE
MLRINKQMGVYLIRHAEAYKNLEGVQGGGDQRLTRAGKYRAKSLGRYLLAVNHNNGSEGLRIVHQPEGRCRATAELIGKILSSNIVECAELAGVGLGDVGGLSQTELSTRYPDVFSALLAWRLNKGTLQDYPQVPGSEPMGQFTKRVHAGIISSLDADATTDPIAFIGTTSTLNMMNHLLVNDGVFDPEHYICADFPLGSLVLWHLSAEAPVQITPGPLAGVEL